MISDSLLEYAVESYDFDKSTLQFVTLGRELSKQIYSFKKHNKEYVLRFVKCHSSHIGQTRAEMDWLTYLAGKGISVPFPLKTVNGELAILAEENGEAFILTAYSKVKGQPWDKNDPNRWNEKVFYNWGKVMGDIHHATKDYEPVEGKEKRPGFSNIILDSVKAFPSVDRVAKELIKEITILPKDRDSYGLVNYDMNPYNFLIDGDKINVFDFDDCTYAWFALDIGSTLYTSLWFGRHNDAGHDFTNDIIEHFLMGYLSANNLNNFWLSKIPTFMRLCQIAKFSYIYYSEEPHDDHQKERMRNIENNALFTECTVDYSLFRNG